MAKTDEADITPFSPAVAMIAALRAGRVSAVELLELHLRRIERLDPQVNAVVVKDYERARRDAAAADELRASAHDAPLLGLPVTVKESIDVEGLPSTAGVPERVGHRAAADAPTVRRLRAAGAVIFGKTNVCTWLADYQGDNPVYGRTNNPWDPTRTSGGSTAGAAALAAGFVPLEIGSDLGGSMRVPAAFCGLVGHKPSQGAVPNSGHFPGSSSPNPTVLLAAQGPHARSAADVELALDVIAGPDVGDDAGWRLTLPPARCVRLDEFRVAVLPDQDWLPIDPEIVAARESLIGGLRDAGAQVAELQPPGLGNLDDVYRLFRSLMYTTVSLMWPAEKREKVIADILERGGPFHVADARGVGASASDYVLWHGQREAYRAAYRAFFREWDILLTPATPVPAFAHTREPYADRRFSIAGREVDYGYLSFYPALATLTGQPGTAFPVGFTSSGLPIGLQAIGPFLEDRTTLAFAALVERAFGGFRPPPGYE